MKHEELVNMTTKDLKARLKEIGAQAQTAEGETLDALVSEAEDINGILQDIQNRANIAGLAAQTAEGDNGEAGEEGGANVRNKKREERGSNLKNGKTVQFNAKTAFSSVKNALSVTQTATPKHTATDVRETFNNVSSLVDRVKAVPLEGGESYQRGYVKSYGSEAGTTAENQDYSSTEPVFGYVTMEKQKITAYTEEPEEMIKLPNADYDGVVEESVTRAIRKKMNRLIMTGDGTNGNFKGIFYNPTKTAEQVIDPATDLKMKTIDSETLDEIIYSYGGEEEVEDVATLILNKKDLKAFAKLKDKQGRKFYTIVNRGNTGEIDGVPYVINSACKAVTDAQTSTAEYCMAYGPLSNYEMPIFSDVDARKSTDYKFKQGQIAYRADIFAGGAVAAYNGFIRVVRPKTGE